MASKLNLSPQFLHQKLHVLPISHRPLFLLPLNFNRIHLPPLQASRPSSNFPQKPEDWKRNLGFYEEDEIDDDDDDEEEEEEEEEDRSLDLLIKFVQNVFRKISRKARKAVRSVLPINISTKLVGFSVNGVIILAFLWILKAFLEVICTLGTVVFVSILLVRGIWTGIQYLKNTRNLRTDEFDDVWTNTQPASAN